MITTKTPSQSQDDEEDDEEEPALADEDRNCMNIAFTFQLYAPASG